MSDTVHYDEVLQDLIDGRVPADEEGLVRAHLATCSRCRSALEQLEAGRAAAVSLRRDISLPPGLALSIAAALDDEDHQSREVPSAREAGSPDARAPRLMPSPGTWRLAAAAAVILAVTLVAVLWNRPVDVVEQAARDFDAVVTGETPLGIRSANAAELQAYLAATSSSRIRVIDLAMMGFTLEGARRHEIVSRPSALYAYRGKGDVRIVCQMYPGDEGDLPPSTDVRDHGGFRFHVVTRGDVTLVFWVEGDLVCVLVSRMPTGALVELAFAKAMRPS